MRFLVDECLYRQIYEGMSSAGFDTIWARHKYAGEDDDVLLAVSVAEDRIIVSEDRDFGELTFKRKLPAVGIVLAKVGEFDGKIDDVSRHIVSEIQRLGTSLTGSFTVIEPNRIRQRPLPSTP